MSRVLGVVGNSIMVSIHDVVDGDILHFRGAESDPIIERVERDGGYVRFHYKDRPQSEGERNLGLNPVQVSNWMSPDDPGGSARVFIHDLRNERREFQEMSNA